MQHPEAVRIIKVGLVFVEGFELESLGVGKGEGEEGTRRMRSEIGKGGQATKGVRLGGGEGYTSSTGLENQHRKEYSTQCER